MTIFEPTKEVFKRNTEKRFLDINEAAVYLGISKNTLYHWAAQGRFPYVKMGHLVRFDIKRIETWIKERKIEPYELSA